MKKKNCHFKYFLLLIIPMLFLMGCSFSIGSNTNQTQGNNQNVSENTELKKEIERLQNQLASYTDEITYADVMDAINQTSTESIKGNVMVETTGYKVFNGFRYNGKGGQGSGVIFAESSDSKYYYVLTNNHVVYIDDSYTVVYYQIKDYIGTSYSGTLVCASPDYDLAVLRFRKVDVELNALTFAKENPKEGDIVIAMGQPEGQNNTITIGKVKGYENVQLKDTSIYESNVNFEVISHNAPINHGSSGGVLMDLEGEIVGINFAGSFDENGTFLEALSIPISKVQEFLKGQNLIS